MNSSTAIVGNSSRPLPSCPGCAPGERPEAPFDRRPRAPPRRIAARRRRAVARVLGQLALKLVDPCRQRLDLTIHPQQRPDHDLAPSVADRLRLSPLHTTGFDTARLCPPTGLNAYRITAICGEKVRDTARPGKRTTGLEPATFGLGSRRSTS